MQIELAGQREIRSRRRLFVDGKPNAFESNRRITVNIEHFVAQHHALYFRHILSRLALAGHTKSCRVNRQLDGRLRETSGFYVDDAGNRRGQDFMCMARSERESSCLADRNGGTASLLRTCDPPRAY
jgi:hypothetical protein